MLVVFFCDGGHWDCDSDPYMSVVVNVVVAAVVIKVVVEWVARVGMKIE